MLHILYLLFIAPLEYWMEFVLAWGYSLTHAWGLAVVVLSLVVNTVILPIYNKAERWQEEERELKRGMARHEAMIRRTFKGQKRFALLSALRRRHGYTYSMSLRASVGLLLQIPFFFAAYHLLSHYEALFGKSFGPLADLGAPDGLLTLGGLRVNLLPIAMTAVNLASAFVYTRALTRRDKAQMYGMAALFLVLLYNSPAALTLYWTLNNVFSLGKNIIEKWWLRSRSRQNLRAHLQNRRLAVLGQDTRTGDAARTAVFLYREFGRFTHAACYGFGIGGLFWLVTCVAVLATNNGEFDAAVKPVLGYYTWQFALTALLVSFAMYVVIMRWPRPQSAIFPLLFCAGIAFLFLLQLYFFKKGFQAEDNCLIFDILSIKGLFYFLVWLLCIVSIKVFFPDNFFIIKYKKLDIIPIYNIVEQKYNFTYVYIYTCFFISSMIFYLSCSFYNADPSIFASDIFHIISSILIIIYSLILLFILLWSIMPKKMRICIVFVCITFVFSSLINYLLFTPKLGSLQGGVFNTTEYFNKKNDIFNLLFQIFIPLILSYIVLKNIKLRQIYNQLLIVMSLLFIIISCCMIIPYGIHGDLTVDYKNYNKELHSYSKKGENVIIFIFDTFTGAHIEKMIADRWFDNFSEKLDGFTWYPNTISAGSTTVLSLRSIFGGHKYTPDSINKNNDNLVKTASAAYALLPRNFAKYGYHINIIEGLFDLDKKLFNKYIGNGVNILTLDNIERNINNNTSDFFLIMSIFEMSPDILRKFMYNNGKWHGLLNYHLEIGENILVHQHEIASFFMENPVHTDSEYPTLKIFYSMIAHEPWIHDPDLKDGKVQFLDILHAWVYRKTYVDGYIQAKYFAERHLMRMVINFIEILKKANIYDNTRIIIVSDHDRRDSQMIMRAYNNGKLMPDGQYFKEIPKYSYAPGQPHALLMVKEPNRHGMLRSSAAFMSTADVPALAMKSIGECDEFALYDPEQLPDPRILIHASGSPNMNDHNSTSFNCKFYQFEGTLFDPEKVREVQIDKTR